jgi:hypothetical protein
MGAVDGRTKLELLEDFDLDRVDENVHRREEKGETEEEKAADHEELGVKGAGVGSDFVETAFEFEVEWRRRAGSVFETGIDDLCAGRG